MLFRPDKEGALGRGVRGERSLSERIPGEQLETARMTTPLPSSLWK
jgi:hypothetical protein